MMEVEAVVPDEHVGDVVGDFSSRRGQIEGMDSRTSGITAVRSMVPLSEMFGYATTLRSMTSGRGNFTMQFHSYAPVSASVSDKILKKELA
jgi:elongation factor G